MTVIELPDDQAAALKAKAAAQGLTLEAWFKKLAQPEAPTGKSRYSLSELMQQCDTTAPLSDEDREWLDAPTQLKDVSRQEMTSGTLKRDRSTAP